MSTLASTKRSRTEVEMPAFWSATHHRPSEISTRQISFVRPWRPSERRRTIFV